MKKETAKVKKVKVFIDYLKTTEQPIEERCLEAVQEHPKLLRYIKHPTPAVCQAAIQRNALAIQYIKDPTLELCLEAVKKNSIAFRHIQHPTDELLLRMVQWDGWLLNTIPLVDQTEHLCFEAIKQDATVLRSLETFQVNERLLLEAIKNDGQFKQEPYNLLPSSSLKLDFLEEVCLAVFREGEFTSGDHFTSAEFERMKSLEFKTFQHDRMAIRLNQLQPDESPYNLLTHIWKEQKN